MWKESEQKGQNKHAERQVCQLMQLQPDLQAHEEGINPLKSFISEEKDCRKAVITVKNKTKQKKLWDIPTKTKDDPAFCTTSF